MHETEISTICERLAEGASLRSICRDMSLLESTVRYWLQSNEQAFAHSVRAREMGCDALADECLEIADAPSLTQLDVADKRIRIDTRIRLIGKWSQRYSDKMTIKSEQTVTHKYDLDSLSDHELDALEAILAKSDRGSSSEGAALPAVVH